MKTKHMFSATKYINMYLMTLTDQHKGHRRRYIVEVLLPSSGGMGLQHLQSDLSCVVNVNDGFVSVRCFE